MGHEGEQKNRIGASLATKAYRGDLQKSSPEREEDVDGTTACESLSSAAQRASVPRFPSHASVSGKKYSSNQEPTCIFSPMWT